VEREKASRSLRWRVFVYPIALHERLTELAIDIGKRIMSDRLDVIRAWQHVAIRLVEQNPTRG